MRKMFLLFGMLAMVGILFVACSDQQDLTSPEDAAFGKNKPLAQCVTPQLEQEQDLYAAIGEIFLDRKSKRGAISNIENIARKVCTDGGPNIAAALEQYAEFEILVNGQPLEKLIGGEPTRQALLTMAYSFATAATYDPGFTVFTIDPDATEVQELVASNSEGALKIYPGTFPSGDEVTLVAYRLPDDFTGGPDYSFAPYIPLPELWFFDANVQPVSGGPKIEFWMCLVEDPTDPYLYDRSVIAHAKDDVTVELLDGEDRLTPENATPPAGLYCTDAQAQVAAGPVAKNLLQAAGAALKPVLARFLGVKPLNAMYFAGKGLGGRGTSFSPFAPVEAGRNELTLEISDGFGTLEIDGTVYCGAAPTAAVCGPYFADTGTTVYVTANPAEGYEVSWTGCSDSDGNVCEVLMDSDKTVSAEFTLTVAPSTQIAFVSGRDLWLMDADGSIYTNITNEGFVPPTDPEACYNGDRAPTWHPDGSRLAFHRLCGGGIFMIDVDGTGLTSPIGSPDAVWPAWSPLGNRIAYVDSGIWTVNVDGSDLQPVVSAGNTPAWSPDGTQIVYSLNDDLWVVNSDGSGVPVNITESATGDRTPAWSPGGDKIAFTRIAFGGIDVADVWDIYVINTDGSGAVNVTNTPEMDNQVDWSADGSMLTYWSRPVGGNNQIFVKAADGSGSATQLTSPPGNPGYSSFDPVWRPPVVVETPQ